MQIHWDLNGVARDEINILTVGTFDGVHLGHQFLIEELKRRANDYNGDTTVVTFNPHPQLVLESTTKPGLRILTTIEEKIAILESLGIDHLYVIEFTQEFSKTASEDFVRKQLFRKLGFSEIVIGHDHAFGKNREGDIETLKTIGRELEFRVDALPGFEIDGVIISSTKIRKLLMQGQVQLANQYLGRNYGYEGRVVEGEGRGKGLSFATANVEAISRDKLIPGDGVYAVYVQRGRDRFKGMMNIGMRPTFNSTRHTAEVHLIDFAGNIYGEKLEIEFVCKIRDEFKFTSADELVHQLRMDKAKSLQIL